MRTWFVFRLSLDDRLRAIRNALLRDSLIPRCLLGYGYEKINLKNILKFSLPLSRASSLHLQGTLGDPRSLQRGEIVSKELTRRLSAAFVGESS